MENIELLAPVGSMESLYAAVQNGAKAVYLGGELFNARHYASNFNKEEMKKAVKYSHLRDVKVYVTVNILLENKEMIQALDYVKFLYDIGVDAIIVQDIGLASLVRKLLPDMDIHASTQMTINNLEGAKFLYKQGFTRVVLSREVPIEEIKYISKNSPIELEVFIHGALCVSYSGQCLMSSMIGGRSGNRGKCAQPCRMPSTLVDKKGYTVNGWEEKHILSPKDLNTLEEILELKKAGVTSLKIEGRMKRPEYVATVVDLYNKVLNKGIEKITDLDKENIKQVFNRGFTKGITFGEFGKDFISYNRPDNRGVQLGRVVKLDHRELTIELSTDVEEGDIIEFIVGQDKYKGLKATKSGKKGEYYTIEKRGNIVNNSIAYKKTSTSLLESSKESYREDRIKRKIDMSIKIEKNEKPMLEINYNNNKIKLIGEEFVQESKNRPLTEETVEEQISKLGDTVYELDKMEIDLEEGCFMPLSSLNSLRRKGTDKLDSLILGEYRKKEVLEEDFIVEKNEILSLESIKEDKEKILTIKVDNFNQLEQLDLEKVDKLIINYYDNKDQLIKSLAKLQDSEIEIYIGTEAILYRDDIELLKEVLSEIKNDITGVSVSNLGTLFLIKENYDLEIHGDIGLNAFNSYTVKFLEENGVTSLDLSVELRLDQIEKIANESSIRTSVISYGYIPVMITKHCPMSLVKGCINDDQCRSCQYSKGYGIKDRIGVEFKMTRKTGFTNIYNSVPIMVLDNLKRIVDSGLDGVRMDFTLEEDGIEELQDIYYGTIKNHGNKSEMESFMDDFRENNKITNGHFFRGIIE